MPLSQDEYNAARGALDAAYAEMGVDYRKAVVAGFGVTSLLEQALRSPKGKRVLDAFGGDWVAARDTLANMQKALAGYDQGGQGADMEALSNTLRQGTQRLGGTPEKTAPNVSMDGGQRVDVDPNQVETDKINAYIDELVQSLRQPVVDPVTGRANDSIYDTLLKSGATAGATSATMRGVGGPLAGVNAMETAQSAALPYLQQRQGLLANALGLQSSRNMGLEQLRQSASGLQMQQANFNNAVAMNNWASDQNKQQGLLGGLGAIGGGIVGGLTGGPLGIVPGAKAGAGLFAGIGSATSPGPTLSPVTPYKPGVR